VCCILPTYKIEGLLRWSLLSKACLKFCHFDEVCSFLWYISFDKWIWSISSLQSDIPFNCYTPLIPSKSARPGLTCCLCNAAQLFVGLLPQVHYQAYTRSQVHKVNYDTWYYTVSFFVFHVLLSGVMVQYNTTWYFPHIYDFYLIDSMILYRNYERIRSWKGPARA